MVFRRVRDGLKTWEVVGGRLECLSCIKMPYEVHDAHCTYVFMKNMFATLSQHTLTVFAFVTSVCFNRALHNPCRTVLCKAPVDQTLSWHARITRRPLSNLQETWRAGNGGPTWLYGEVWWSTLLWAPCFPLVSCTARVSILITPVPWGTRWCIISHSFLCPRYATIHLMSWYVGKRCRYNCTSLLP